MKQIIIPFKENADIPEAHLYALRVCNSAGAWHYKQSFYKLKNEILKKYGHEADYDLQTIKKKCWSCDGKGNHDTGNACWNCDKGVYQTKRVVLKRYILNGALFHEPMGELSYFDKLKIFDGYEDWYPTFKYEAFNGRIVNQIEGLITHEPMELSPTWSFYYLLWNYNREQFYKQITSDVNSYQTRAKHKLKKMLEKSNPLKVFADYLKVKPQQLEPIDDLPF